MELSNGTRKALSGLLALFALSGLIRAPAAADGTLAGLVGALTAVALIAYGAYRVWPSAPDEPVEGEATA
jgi:hypothetical protein